MRYGLLSSRSAIGLHVAALLAPGRGRRTWLPADQLLPEARLMAALAGGP